MIRAWVCTLALLTALAPSQARASCSYYYVDHADRLADIGAWVVLGLSIFGLPAELLQLNPKEPAGGARNAGIVASVHVSTILGVRHWFKEKENRAKKIDSVLDPSENFDRAKLMREQFFQAVRKEVYVETSDATELGAQNEEIRQILLEGNNNDRYCPSKGKMGSARLMSLEEIQADVIAQLKERGAGRKAYATGRD